MPETGQLKKQQKFNSHNSGGWNFEIRVPAWSGEVPLYDIPPGSQYQAVGIDTRDKHLSS